MRGAYKLTSCLLMVFMFVSCASSMEKTDKTFVQFSLSKSQATSLKKGQEIYVAVICGDEKLEEILAAHHKTSTSDSKTASENLTNKSVATLVKGETETETAKVEAACVKPYYFIMPSDGLLPRSISAPLGGNDGIPLSGVNYIIEIVSDGNNIGTIKK